MRPVMRAIVILLSVYLSACKTGVTAAPSPTPGVGAPAALGTSPVPSLLAGPSPVAVVPPLLRMTLKSAYESSPSSMTTQTDCVIPAGSPSGTVISCSATIAEADAYYSVFQIDLKAGKGACRIVKFLPYSYQRSSSNAFVPEGTTTQSVDCSGAANTLSPLCFGGIAKEVISGFPSPSDFTALPTTTWSKSFYLASSHQVGAMSNRRIINDLVDRTNTIVIPKDGYIGNNTMQDYQLLCLDDSNNITQSITLNVLQAPGGAGTEKSWISLPTAAQPILKLSLNSASESTPTEMINRATCSIPNASAPGTVVNCIANIPEADLYYSNFQLNLTADKSACNVVKFAPYSYQKSNSSAFVPEGTSSLPVDCSGSLGSLPLACYGGIAKEIVPNFPGSQSFSVSPTTNWMKSYFWPSSHSTGISSNRRVSNDLVDRQTSLVLPGDGYIGSNSMQDYQLLCLDAGNNVLQTISLSISQATGGAGVVKSWTNLPNVTATPSILNLTLSSAAETTPNQMTSRATCTVPNGSPSGTFLNCSASIPEADLYYSSFSLNLSSDISSCNVVKFIPYSYQKSTSAGFIPEGANAQSIDCSGVLANLSPTCFGGVGKELIPNFPQSRSISVVPTAQWTKSYFWPSSHSTGISSNRRIANDLSDRQTPIVLSGDGYSGNGTMNDYQFQCLDSGNNVTQSISLNISQAPGGAGAIKSWVNLPIVVPPTSPPPLSVQFTTFGANDTNLQTPTNQFRCDVTNGNSNDCTFNYPEAQLYYSKTLISVSIPPNTCDFFRFYPYYYRASNSNGFNPEWAPQTGAGLNCYGLSNSTDPRCFSGAAVSIIPQGPSAQNTFPLNKSLTYFPGTSTFSQSWTVPSAFDSNRKSNRWMASNLASVNRNSQVTLQGDGFAGGGEFQDYMFTCYQNDGTSKYSSVVHVQATPASPADPLQDWTNAPLAPPPPMSVRVATYWEDDIAKQFPTIQPNASTTFFADSGTPNKVAAVNIPSAQLYYSQLQFTLSVPPNTCDIVEFLPYYYLASVDPAFIPEWKQASPVDCSKLVKPTDCFNGPIDPLLNSAGVPFPPNTGIVYFPSQRAFGQSWTAPSANGKGRLSNQYTANILSSRGATNAIGTGYVGNSMQDWTFNCKGPSGLLLYSILLHVTPTLSNGTTVDNTSAWNGL